MTEGPYRYDRMVENALRSVIKESLLQAIKFGLIKNHHFYITFRTDFPGVDIADWLHERYPEEMTIVLQNQYWDLKVDDRTFSVSLSFNDIAEPLTIPFAAVTAFADPGVNFGLQFQPTAPTEDVKKPSKVKPGSELQAKTKSMATDSTSAETQEKIVTLDAFRKKDGG